MEIRTTQHLSFTPFTFTPMYKEKRTFARLDLHAKANIHLDDQTIEAKLENLSIKGAFLTLARPMVISDAAVAVTIYNTLTPKIFCNLKAKVVRVTDKGIGLQFEKTLLD